MDDSTSKKENKMMKKYNELVLKFATILMISLTLSGCENYSIFDEAQYYEKISEGVGFRVNTEGYEFCYENADGITIDCIELVDNPYLEGDFKIVEIGEVFSIFRDELGILYIEFSSGDSAPLLFSKYNEFYVYLEHSVAKLSLVFEGEHNHILIGDDPNNTLHFVRIIEPTY